MPLYCEVYETKQAAAESLADIHDLSGYKTRQLKRDMYLELDLHTHGNEYCEIAECNCDTPCEHSESPVDFCPHCQAEQQDHIEFMLAWNYRSEWNAVICD
jgi:hypothetical protein